MEPDPSSTLVRSRCDHCGGRLRPDAPWCTLCLTRTSPEQPEAASGTQAAPVPTVATARTVVALDPLTAPFELLVDATPTTTSDPTWPCATCESTNPLEAIACVACGAGFLDVVRLAEPPLVRLPLLGDAAQLTKAQLLGLAFAVVAAVLVLTLAGGLLLG